MYLQSRNFRFYVKSVLGIVQVQKTASSCSFQPPISAKIQSLKKVEVAVFEILKLVKLILRNFWVKEIFRNFHTVNVELIMNVLF